MFFIFQDTHNPFQPNEMCFFFRSQRIFLYYLKRFTEYYLQIEFITNIKIVVAFCIDYVYFENKYSYEIMAKNCIEFLIKICFRWVENEWHHFWLIIILECVKWRFFVIFLLGLDIGWSQTIHYRNLFHEPLEGF